MTTRPDLHIDLSIQDPEWNTIPDIEQLSRKVVSTAISTAALPGIVKNRKMEISIVLANDDLIRTLNRTYRQKDKPTNVLTFATLDSEEPENDAPVPLGDVILAYQTIEREARTEGKLMHDHLLHILVHGALHLLGYDHENDDDATVMETLEIRILEKLGVQNPYTGILYTQKR